VKRKARERVRSEQEAAFQESLEADKLKHKLKIEEERKKEQEIKQQQSAQAAREVLRKNFLPFSFFFTINQIEYSVNY